jgi:hypothetical protein
MNFEDAAMRRITTVALLSAAAFACTQTPEAERVAVSRAAMTTPLDWSGWQLFPGGGVTATPDAPVAYQGKLYVFGIGIDDHAHYVDTFDGIQWSGWSAVPGGGTTLVADTAVVFNGTLYLFGIGIDDHGHYVNSFNGTSWSGWSAVPGGGTTLVSDATAVFNGKLYLFGIGIDDHGHYVNTFDGVSWSGWSGISGGGTTLVPDTAAVLNGALYVFSVGLDGNHYYNSSSGGAWSGWAQVPGGFQSAVASSATAYDGQINLFAVSKTDGTHHVNAFDGTTWGGWSVLPGGGAVFVSDAATVYHNAEYLIGVGEDDQHYFQVGSMHGTLPKYNQVTWQATHNSYWVDRDNVVEIGASGTQERLLDSVHFEGARAWELDLHHDDTTPHNFTVYHTNFPSNSFCPQLGDCLQNLLDLQHALPDHDPFTIVFELKEVTSEPMFSADHTPADIDAILERYLGPYLYRPAEFLAQCGGEGTMRACAAAKGWPTIDQLRGKFIPVVMGNWEGPKQSGCNNGAVFLAHDAAAWVDYVTGPGGAAARTAFSMESPWMTPNITCLEGIPQATVNQAVADSPFVQMEVGSAAVLTQPCNSVTQPTCEKAFVAQNIVARTDVGGQNEPSLTDQLAIVAADSSLIQNDHPWFQPNAGGSPLRVDMPTPLAPVSDLTWLNEPGHRTMLKQLDAGTKTSVPAIYGTPLSAHWETTVSDTRPATVMIKSTDPAEPNPMNPRGEGCLFASTVMDDNGNYQYGIRVCRTTADGHWNVSKPLGEDVIIDVDVVQAGSTTTSTYYSDDRDTAGFGEMLRLDVNQSPTENACVTVYSSESTATDVPIWHGLLTQCFPTKLLEQGLAADNGDVLFVGTKHAWSTGPSAPAVATDFFDPPYSIGAGYAVIDLTWPPVNPPQTCEPDIDGGCAIPIHRSYGTIGHFYSPDIKEAGSWGLHVEAADYFYIEQKAGGSWATPFYRCVNPSDGHRFLTTSSTCEGSGWSREETLGSIATSQVNGTVPLYRLYSSSGDDHLYTLSSAEVQSAEAQGYKSEGIAGYVWTAGDIEWPGGPIQ